MFPPARARERARACAHARAGTRVYHICVFCLERPRLYSTHPRELALAVRARREERSLWSVRMGQPSYPSRTCFWLLQVTVTVTTLAILQCGAIAPAGGTVRVGVRRTAANLAELERLFWAISEPGNPQYQQYLTPAQLSVLRASASADTAAVVAWLHE
eukprot:COSAG02_NODE_26362_length_634_cov_9.583178_1_plen_158_part_01